MKIRPSSASFLVIALSGLASCGGEPSDTEITGLPAYYASELPHDKNPAISAAEYSTFISKRNELAFRLLQSFSQSESENVVLSPLSVSSALGMIYAGSAGDTKEGIASALMFEQPDSIIHAGFNQIELDVESKGLPASDRDEALTLDIQNALWVQQGSEPNQNFLDALATNYGSGVYALDFAQNAEAARVAINDAVSEATQQRIPEILPSSAIAPDTRVVLTSAILLSGPWKHQFNELSTTLSPFYNLDGSTTEVDMMHANIEIGYYSDDDVDVAALPMINPDIELLFVVPKSDFTAYSMGFLSTHYSTIVDSLVSEAAFVALPKFEVEYDAPVTKSLKSLGMDVAFTDQADFSPMGLAALKLSSISHKATIEVTESGVSATAATAVVAVVTGAPSLELLVDKPFIFVIHDKSSKAILFAGRVTAL